MCFVHFGEGRFCHERNAGTGDMLEGTTPYEDRAVVYSDSSEFAWDCG